jgi:hypothetical protein
VVLSHSHRIRCTCNSCFNHRPVATQLRITELRAMNGKCQPPSPRPRTVTPGDSQSSLVARPTLCITNSFNSIMNSYREYRTSDLQLAVDGIHEWEAKCGPAYMTDEISERREFSDCPLAHSRMSLQSSTVCCVPRSSCPLVCRFR